MSKVNVYKKNKASLRARLKGYCLDGCICHHIKPRCMGGDNSVRNLCYMPEKNEKRLHKEIGVRPNFSFEQFQKLAIRWGGVGVMMT